MLDSLILITFSNNDDVGCFEAVEEWLEKQNLTLFEQQCKEYISRVFQPEVPEAVSYAWPEAEKISTFRKHLTAYKKFDSCPNPCVGRT